MIAVAHHEPVIQSVVINILRRAGFEAEPAPHPADLLIVSPETLDPAYPGKVLVLGGDTLPLPFSPKELIHAVHDAVQSL